MRDPVLIQLMIRHLRERGLLEGFARLLFGVLAFLVGSGLLGWRAWAGDYSGSAELNAVRVVTAICGGALVAIGGWLLVVGATTPGDESS